MTFKLLGCLCGSSREAWEREEAFAPSSTVLEAWIVGGIVLVGVGDTQADRRHTGQIGSGLRFRKATEGQAMAQAMEETLAVPDKRAAKLVGISMRQLRYWEEIGLVVPSVTEQISPRNTVRLYSYQDLLELLAAAELRHQPGISLQHIRRVVSYLRTAKFNAPLRELNFAVRGNEIYFQYPDGTWSGDKAPRQIAFHQVLTLSVFEARIRTVRDRDPEDAGRVVRRRGVHGSKPIFAGTRITVGAVQRYLQVGFDDKAIIGEYPLLTPADIEAARQYPAVS